MGTWLALPLARARAAWAPMTWALMARAAPPQRAGAVSLLETARAGWRRPARSRTRPDRRAARARVALPARAAQAAEYQGYPAADQGSDHLRSAWAA